MSRILRRPMFRGGGKVSSYGNGIATGLANGGMPGKRGLVTGPGGYAGELFGGKINANVPQAQFTGGATNTGGNILTRNLSKIKNLGTGNLESRLGQGIRSIYNMFPEEGLLSKGSRFATSQFPKALKGGSALAVLSAPSMLAEMNRPQTYEALQFMKENSKNNAGVFDETAFDDFTEYDSQFQKLNDPTKYSAMPDNRGFFNKLLNPFSGFTGLREKSDEEVATIVEKNKKKIAEKEDADAAATGETTTVDINTGEPVESRKDRLKRTAKEYQEILGDGIKKDSIFDAMVEGGSRLYEGEGLGSSLRAANKALDPIQNIKTASRKLALEEDIAMRRAMAVSAGKSTEMSRRIAAMRAAGRTPEQIADMVAGIKPETLGEKVSKLGKVDGYAEYIKDSNPDINIVTSKVDVSKKPDGKYYIADKFTIVEVKNGAVVVGSEKIIKNS